MKCKYCGGNLGLEDAYCPHCGRPNQLAVQHVRDMNRYRGEFKKTQDAVLKTSGRFSAIAVRAAICAALVVLTVVFLVLGGRAWSFQRAVRQAQARSRATEYSAAMQEFVQDRDYRMLSAFAQTRGVEEYNDEYRIPVND